MRLTGLEPALLLEMEPKSIASANSATGAEHRLLPALPILYQFRAVLSSMETIPPDSIILYIPVFVLLSVYEMSAF